MSVFRTMTAMLGILALSVAAAAQTAPGAADAAPSAGEVAPVAGETVPAAADTAQGREGSVVRGGVGTPAAAEAGDAGRREAGFWMPEQASTVAPQIDLIFDVITWICIFFFVLIVVVMLYFVIKYRRTPGHRSQGSVTHNTPLELTWTIVPLILVIGIFYVGMEGFLNLRQPPTGAYEVNVTAQKWSWAFAHRNGANETGILRVPVGRPVRLNMQSEDVLHSLYIPAFRVKQDVVPGRVTTLWFQATRPGTFQLACTEYCGTDHSRMLGQVIVHEEGEFQAEIDKAAAVFDDAPQEKLADLAAERIYPRCASCHSLDGSTGTGPSWRDLWKDHISNGDRVFTDGTVLRDLVGPGMMFESSEDYIQQSILNPQQKVVQNFPGSMPTFKGQLRPRELTAIIEFIKHLDEFDNEGNRIRPAADAGAAGGPTATTPAAPSGEGQQPTGGQQ